MCVEEPSLETARIIYTTLWRRKGEFTRRAGYCSGNLFRSIQVAKPPGRWRPKHPPPCGFDKPLIIVRTIGAIQIPTRGAVTVVVAFQKRKNDLKGAGSRRNRHSRPTPPQSVVLHSGPAAHRGHAFRALPNLSKDAPKPSPQLPLKTPISTPPARKRPEHFFQSKVAKQFAATYIALVLQEGFVLETKGSFSTAPPDRKRC